MRTKRVWILDIKYIRDNKVQDRRYLCTNKVTIEKYRKGISEKVLSYELRPGRVPIDTVENNVVKLVNLGD